MQDYVSNSRPWVIMAVFPGHKPTAISRTCHRADADAYVRFLQRHIPEGDFYVVFEADDAVFKPQDKTQ